MGKGKEKEMSNWDLRWMQLARLVSSWSKDRSTKVGCCIINGRDTVVAIGWNGFPRRIDDDVDERHERPAKYFWTEHAERNAIFNAANKGLATQGCRMYVSWFPCVDCARAIIQAGIVEVIGGVEPDFEHHKFGEEFKVVREMLEEAGIATRFL